MPAGDSSNFPLIIVIIILFLIIIGLGVWIVFLWGKTTPKCPPPQTIPCPPPQMIPCPPSLTGPPVYLYGFAPGVSVREITGSNGVLTPNNGRLSLAPLNVTAPENQQWRFITQGTLNILQHIQSSNYLINTGQVLGLNPNIEQAFKFTLVGPIRNGRVYRFGAVADYITTTENLTVNITSFVDKALPLNTEWLISLGTCQSRSTELC